MQDRNLVESLVVFAGVWLMVREVPDYATALYLSAAGDLPVSAVGPSVLTAQTVHFLISFGTGLALIFARRIPARIFHVESSMTGISPEPLLAAGVAVVGVYFVVTGLSVLGQLLAVGQELGSQYVLWTSVTSIALGLLLFVGAPWMVRPWRLICGGAQRET